MDMQGVGGSRSKRYRSLCERDDASVAKSKRSKVQVEQAIEKMLQDMKQPDYYEKQGKQNQAGNLRLEVPPTPRRWLGDKHQDSFNHLQAQANAYMRQCRFDMAAFLQLQMLEIRKQHFGHDHPYTIESKHSLACTCAKLCWLEEAEELELEVLSYWRRTFGQEHPKTLQATQVLAVIRYKQNRKGTCEPARLEAIRRTSQPTEIRIGPPQLDNELKSLVQSGLAQISHSPIREIPTSKQVPESDDRVPMRSWDNSEVDGDLDGIQDSSESVNRHSCIGTSTSREDGFKYLADHLCVDLTDQFDPLGYSKVPIAGSLHNDVWLGKLLSQSLLVAIKCPRLHLGPSDSSAKHIKRAVREAYLSTLAARARHPNVMPFLGVALFQGQLALVTPWMSNGTLMAYILKHPNIDRWQFCLQVVEGLACIHGLGMVHGDLKAANVFVSEEGVAKIGDLGNAIQSDGSDFTATSNIGGGTSRWMAQELLLHSEADRSMAADIFALAMTILEVITGRRPYSEHESDPYVTLLVIKGIPPNRPPELSSETRFGDERWALLNECWGMEPEDRPTASAIRDRMRILT